MAKRKAKKVQSKGFEAPNNILKTLTGGVQQTLMVAALGLFVYAVAPKAQALTFESGQVLVTADDGSQSVVDFSETPTGQKQLEEQGFAVGGGMLFIRVEDVVTSVPLHDLQHLTDDQRRDHLRVEIGRELGVEFVVGDATLDDVVNGQLDATLGHDTAIFDATDAALEAYEQSVKDHLSTGPGWYDIGNGPECHTACD